MNLTRKPRRVTFPSVHYVYLEKVGPFQKTATAAWRKVLPLKETLGTNVRGGMAQYNFRGKMIYRAGWILTAKPKKLPAGIRYIRTEPGLFAKFVLKGGYDKLPEASGKVWAAARKQQLPVRQDFAIEHYLNDPKKTPAAKLLTEILVPIDNYKRTGYFVDCFDNKTDELVWEREIKNPDLEYIHKLLKYGADDPEMYNGAMTLTGKTAGYFEKLLGRKFDLQKHTYGFSAMGC